MAAAHLGRESGRGLYKLLDPTFVEDGAMAVCRADSNRLAKQLNEKGVGARLGSHSAKWPASDGPDG